MTLLRLSLLAALLSLLAPSAQGQAAGVFARMGFGARGVAMGNALAADGSGDASPYYNPALAPFVSGQNLSASAAFLTQDRQLQFLQFAAPLRPRAGVAAGLIHAGVTDIDGRDASGYHTQDYSTDEFALFLAFGTRLGERFSGGLSLQLFTADYFEGVDPVLSIGLDVGFTMRVTEALTVGLVVDDALARYSWNTSSAFGEDGKTTSDRFPVRLRVGGAYRLMEGRALLTAEVESRFTSAEERTRELVLGEGGLIRPRTETERLRLYDTRLRVGAEVLLAQPFAVRAGLDRIGSGGLAPTAGFMVEQPVGSLLARAEYAFVLEPYAVGTMHLLTLRVFL